VCGECLLPVRAEPEGLGGFDGLACSLLTRGVDVVDDLLCEVVLAYGAAVEAIELEAAVAPESFLERAWKDGGVA